MTRRRLATLLASTIAALTALTLGGLPSGASAQTDSSPHSKRVCAHAATGFAACDAHVRTDGNLKPLATTSYQSGYSPTQLKSAYGLTGLNGTETVAVVDAYANPNAQADLNVYRSTMKLPATTLIQMNQTGGSIGTVAADVGWGQEEMLDLEMVSAICPGCNIVYVGAGSASFNDLGAAVNTAVGKGKATVVSNSYGAKEFNGETTFAAAYNHPGVAITVSSGDSGYGAQVPAAFNTVTAVGGTSLTFSNSTRTEKVWSGAGSGCSVYITKPTWQHDTACSRRTIADVAAVADPATGVAVYDSYGSSGNANWYVFGGTSVSAPIIAGVYGLSPTATSTPESLYSAVSSLYDVQSGSNGRCVRGKDTSGAYLCTGVSGYDGPTGNGTPNGSLAAF